MADAFPVPLAAQRAAGRALATHRATPGLEDVTGVTVAERLVSGAVDADTIGKMYRFFRQCGRMYADETQRLRSEADSGLVRSWLLHGAEAGRTFAAGLYRQLQAEAQIPEDPLDTLFDATPEQVYARFQMGAWRWEYGLTPSSAARFVQCYTEATGQHLELPKAFGEAAATVGNHIWRRYHGPTPFEQARRALKIDDESLRLAAKADLDAFRNFPLGLVESLNWKSLQAAPARKAAADSWPTWLAYLILAVEAPELLKDLSAESVRPPELDEKPKSFLQYHDALNVWVMYFHPQGRRYHDPDTAEAKKFHGLTATLHNFMVRAWRGKKIQPALAKKVARVARDWVHLNKPQGLTFAGTFNILIDYWKKGAWQELLAALPEDADVRPAFQTFVQQNPMPVGGVELTKKLATDSPDYKTAVAQYQPGWTVRSLEGTATDKAAEKAGTPIGVKSVLRFEKSGVRYTLLAAVQHPTQAYISLFTRTEAGTPTTFSDADIAKGIQAGDVTVIQAHVELPGSVYNVGAATKVTIPAIDPKMSGTQAAIEYVLTKVQGVPAVRADAPEFTHALGAQFYQKIDPSKGVAIAGYAKKNDAPLYVLVNTVGAFQAVAPKFIHGRYPDGPVAYRDDIVSNLKPPPDPKQSIVVTAALRAYLDQTFEADHYTLIGLQGTAFDAAATARGFNAKFGLLWVWTTGNATRTLAAAVHTASGRRIIWYTAATDSFMEANDLQAAARVTDGTIVPLGAVPSPSTTSVTKPEIPADAVGTPEAIAFAKAQGFVPVARAHAPGEFAFELGAIVAGSPSTWFVIEGYAHHADDPSVVVYVARGVKGAKREFHLRSPAEAKFLWTGPIGYDMKVIRALISGPAPKAPTSIKPTLPDELLKADFPDHHDLFERLKTWGQTALAKQVKKQHDITITTDWKFKNVKSGWIFTLVAAYRVETPVTYHYTEEGEPATQEFGPGTIFVMEGPDMDLVWWDSDQLADAFQQGVLTPATADDPELTAQQTQQAAATADPQAKALKAGLTPEQEAIQASMPTGVGKYVFVDPQGTAAGKAAVAHQHAPLAVGSRWKWQHKKTVTILGAATGFLDPGEPSQTLTRIYVREEKSDLVSRTDDAELVQRIEAGDFWPDVPKAEAPTKPPDKFPTPAPTEAEKAALEPFPKTVIQALLKPDAEGDVAFPEASAEDIQLLQAPLTATRWAKAAATHKWTVTKGSVWVWSVISEEAAEQALTPFTILGAVGDPEIGYTIIVEEQGEVVAYDDALLRGKTLTDQVYPQSILPTLAPDVQAALATKGLGSAQPVPLLHTLFGVSAGYMNYQPFVVVGAQWREKGAQPYTLVGAVEGATQNLIIIKTVHGKIQLKNEMTLADLIELGELEPVDAPGLAPAAFEAPVMKELTKTHHVKEYQVGKIDLAQTSSAVVAKSRGMAFTAGSAWRRVGIDEILTLQSAATLPGGQITLVFQKPNGTTATFSDSLFSGLLENLDVLPYEPEAAVSWAPEILDFLKTFDFTTENAPLRTIPLRYTLAFAVAKGGGWDLAPSSEWAWPHSNTRVAILGAVSINGTPYLVTRNLATQALAVTEDISLGGDIGAGAFVPAHLFTPPKFSIGQVVEWAKQPLRVLAFAAKSYVLHKLRVSQPPAVPAAWSQAQVEAESTLRSDTVSPETFLDLAVLDTGIKRLTVLPKGWPSVGSPVQVGGIKGVLAGGVTVGAKPYAVLLTPKSVPFEGMTYTYDEAILLAGALFAPAITTYEPLTYPPTTPIEFAGIKEAFAWATQNGFTIAAKSESTDFLFHLGEIRSSKDAAIRVIVAFGMKGDVPHYIVAEDLELSKFTQKTAGKGNEQYGPPTGLHPDVRKHLLPKPGFEPPKIPVVPVPVVSVPQAVPLALGPIDVATYFSPGKAPPPPTPKPKPASYGTSARADVWLKASPYSEWIEPPPDAPFHTYTTGESDQLVTRDTRQPVTILGWVYDPDTGDTAVVVDLAPNAAKAKAATYNAEAQRANFFATSPNPQVLGDDEGGVTLTEHPDEPDVAVEMPGLTLPHDPGPGWDSPTPLAQEPVVLEPGKDVSAGVVAVLPPNTRFSGGGKVYESPHAMVMLVHPRNNFSGPLAFPKGRVEKGEGLTRAAVREVWEETGVKVRPVALLRNFKAGKPHQPDSKNPDWTGTTTVTRYYIGYIIGGHPRRYGWEADSVTFKPLTPDVEQTRWFKKLSTRDRRVVQRVIAWLQEHGLPQNFSGEAVPFDVQVTAPTDAKGQPLPATQVDPWLSLVQHAPFAVTEPMLAALRQYAGSFQPPQALVAGVSGGPGTPRVGDVGTLTAFGAARCLGYVGWQLPEGAEIRGALFALGDGTVVFRRTEKLTKQWIADPLATATARKDAGANQGWFWHPDAETHYFLRQIHGEGGNLATFGVLLATVQKWMGEAGVPFAQAVTERDLGRVLALFVPHALSRPERDAILQHLAYKARLAAGVSALPVTTPGMVQGGASGGVVAPILAVATLPYFAPANKTLAEEWAGPVLALEPTTAWTLRGPLKTKEGGSKPLYEVEGPDGQAWVFKPHTELQRPAADRAAYQIAELLKPNNNPVGLIHMSNGPHGGIGSVQPFIEGKPLASGTSDTLSDQDLAEIAAQHVVDMFLGDHDGNPQNWMRTALPDGTTGPLVAIDKGQSFKFAVLKVKGETIAGVDPTESLDPFDPTWKRAPGNAGEHLAKRLLRTWLKDGAIPPVAARAMKVTLDRLTAVPDAQLTKILTPILDANNITSGKARREFLAEYRRRRDQHATAWRDLFRKRLNDPTWDWSATTFDPTQPLPEVPSSPEALLLARTPEAAGLGPREATYLAQAAQAGWVGKVIEVDRDAIEDQSVMVKSVLAMTGGTATPYTLVHWRVPKHAGVRAAKRLYPLAKVTDAEIPKGEVGPQRSKIDDHFKLYWRLHVAADNLDLLLSSGYQAGGPPQFAEMLFTQAWGVAGELDKLDAATKDPKGWYTVGAGAEAFGEPNPIVQQVVAQYRQYLSRLRELHDHWSAQNLPRKSGEILKQFPPFVWADDGTYKPPSTVAPKPTTFQVEYVTDSARWPKLGGADDGTLTLSPGFETKSTPQFIIRRGEMAVYFTPQHKDWRAAVGAPASSSAPILAWEGMCWAQIPGPPSPASLTQAMNLWQAATGIETRASEPQDREVLYYMKQAQLAQATRARAMFDGAQGPTFEPAFPGVAGETVVVIHRKGARLYLPPDNSKGFTADPYGKKTRVTVHMALKPGDQVEILGVSPIHPNPDFEGIDEPELAALWKTYQDIDRQPEATRAARYGEILTGLKTFLSQRYAQPVAEIEAQADLGGRYLSHPQRAVVPAEAVAEDGRVLKGRLDVPKGTRILPGTATWRLVIGATTVYVQDTGTGTLDERAFNDKGRMEVKRTDQGLLDYRGKLNHETGAYQITMPVKIRTDPTPEVWYRLDGPGADGVDRGVGARRHHRLGWDRERLKASLVDPAGATPVFVAHNVRPGQPGLFAFWQLIKKNGALLANYIRLLYGVKIHGISAPADIKKGATGGFAGMRRGVDSPDHLYFDLDLLQRTDVGVVGANDAFGAVESETFRTPETWLAAGLNRKTGAVTTSEKHQIVVRNDGDLLEYLVFATAAEEEVPQVIKLCYDRGWTSFWRGRRPEDVIVTVAEARARYKDVL